MPQVQGRQFPAVLIPRWQGSVYLFDGAGSLLVSTVTDVNGVYTFPNRPAGNYRVEVVTNSAAFNTLTPGYDRMESPLQALQQP